MAMTMEQLQQPLLFKLDIKDGLVQQPLRVRLMKGDKQANRIVVVLTDGNKEVDLTGVTVTGFFISPYEQAEIPLKGTAEGNVATVVLLDECYAEDGHFEAGVKLTLNGTARTIISFTGEVLSKGSGAYIDVGNVIPSIDDIVAQYATMQQVTKDAQEAAEAANAAAENAPYISSGGTWMTWDAESGKYVNTGVDATGPQGIPGTNGTTPHIGDNGNWFIGDVDTGVKAQGPAGANGTGSGTVTGVMIGAETYEPDDTGIVDMTDPLARVIAMAGDKAFTSLTGSALSAMAQADRIALYTGGTRLLKVTNGETTVLLMLNEDGTTQWAGGERPVSLLDNSDFSNPVNQRGQTSYKYGTNKYTIDRWYTYGNLDVNDGYITLTPGASAFNVYQYFPLGTFTAGKIYTAAAKLLDGTIICGFGACGDDTGLDLVNDATTGVRMQLAANRGGTGKGTFNITIGTTKTINYVWVALYEGSYTAETLPPYVPKGYSAELAECMRYFLPVNAIATAYGTSMNSGTGGSITVSLPTPMRQEPSVSVKQLGFLRVNGTSYTVTSIAIHGMIGNLVSLNVNCEGSTVPTGHVAVLVSAQFDLSADL